MRESPESAEGNHQIRMYEENGFSVEIVRKHIAMREKVEKLREQFEEVKGEIGRLITEKAEIEEHFEAMKEAKEAKDHQIASLILKRIVLEEDMTDMERDFQTSVASLGITDGVNLDMGSISSTSRVGLKVCSNIKWNNQVLSKEVTSQVDSSPISEKIGYNLVSDKYMDLDAGQLSSSGAYGSVTRIIEGLLSQKKKLFEGSRSLSLMRIHSKKEVLKSDGTIPQIIDLEDENDSLERLSIVKAKEVTEITHSVLSTDQSSRTIQSAAGKKLLKKKGGRPRKLDGFMVASSFPRKRKKRIVLESDAEHPLPKSQKTTEKGKDAREELVGCRIKVWWPADEQYYEGIVESYDPTRKKHKVAYFDGDKENLILKKERWLRDDEKSDSQQDQMVPSAFAMPLPAAESEIESKSNKDQEHEKAV